ncbi:MAG: MaoC family dehydratase N-terminal domain-containing protein [Candidatus Binatia bacterium]
MTTTSVRLRARGQVHRSGLLRRRSGAAGRLPQPAGAADVSRHAGLHSRRGRTTPSARRGRALGDHGLKGLLDGGTETEYFADICAGDTLTAVSKIAGLDVRVSPSLKMLLLSTETTTNQLSPALVARQRGQAIFY